MKAWRKFLHYGVYTVITVVGIAVVAILVFPYRWLDEKIFQEVHRLHQANVIVVLFGDSNEERTEVGRDTHRRVVYGVKLFQKGYAPKIIFSGGNPDGANLMAKFGAQLGVSSQDMIIENRSRDTISNWDNTARIVKARQWTSVLLVSRTSHVARAMRIINPHGITIYPAAVPYNSCDPPYTRVELMQAFWHDIAAYGLYVVSGKQAYERVVDYMRK